MGYSVKAVCVPVCVTLAVTVAMLRFMYLLRCCDDVLYLFATLLHFIYLHVIYLFLRMHHCDLFICYVVVIYLFACAAGCCCAR